MRKVVFSLIFIFCINVTGTLAQEEKPNHSFESSIGASWFGFQPFNLRNSLVSLEKMIPVYGSIDMRYCYKSFCPEVRIDESGVFAFDRDKISLGDSGPSGYSNYYVKIPTMIPMPFFSFVSRISIDASYTSMFQRFKLKENAYYGDTQFISGTTFSSVYSLAMVRLVLDTPIVENPSLFQHSYFGLFYSESVMPSSVASGAAPYTNNMIVDTKLISGGIFYDMKKDMFVKGLNLGISVHLGYGEAQVPNDFNTTDVSFGNLYGLFTIRATGEISYRYVFKNKLGVIVRGGAEYFSAAEFINKADTSKYSVNLSGGVRYYVGASFIFGI